MLSKFSKSVEVYYADLDDGLLFITIAKFFHVLCVGMCSILISL